MEVNRSMLELLDNLGHKVLAVFRCGSSIYDMKTSDSDEDYIVIVDDYDDCQILKDHVSDLFVIGISALPRVFNLEKNILEYFLMWVDNVDLLKENIVQIDEDRKEEILSLLKVDWDKCFYRWLNINLDYFRLNLIYGPEEKVLYNLYKLNSITKHYLETKEFKSFYSIEDRKLALDFKSHKEKRLAHNPKLHEIFNYLEMVVKEGEQ